MLHRPGRSPRARNSSASHAGAPGARGSNGWASDGWLAIRHRIRAPLKVAWPPSRIKKAATPDRSEATASRRVAVKSSAAGSPHSSPMTQDRAAHLSPSSIAHSAARASRASTWMRLARPSPGGWIRPLSRMAIRSCTHSSGLPRSICGNRKPAQPASRGAAKSSLSVGWGEEGSSQCSCKGRNPVLFPRARRDWAPAFAGAWVSAGSEGAETRPPATRDKPFATRLTTLLFFFCSYSCESAARVNGATRR